MTEAEGTDGTDYTNLSFLSSLKTAPKKGLFKQLSLDTDLQEIHQLLNSPRGVPKPKPLPTTLDVNMTKTFFLSLMAQYEPPEQTERKWQAFLDSLASPPDFDKFVASLKEIKQENPEKEKEPNKEPQLQQRRRANSLRKAQQQQKETENVETRLKASIKKDLADIKDLLAAGERFIRQA